MAATNLFNPFPGLRPFGAEEDYLFFGREEQTRELLQLLRAHRFLAVVGTSGSGKSSLVRAGLLPALYGGTMVGAGSDWSTVVFRPGGDPLLNLAEQMIEANLYDPEDDETPSADEARSPIPISDLSIHLEATSATVSTASARFPTRTVGIPWAVRPSSSLTASPIRRSPKSRARSFRALTSLEFWGEPLSN